MMAEDSIRKDLNGSSRRIIDKIFHFLTGETEESYKGTSVRISNIPTEI
jgi:hypothetical protein